MMIIGHRGACGYSVENTVASVQKAVELGVDMVEIDVRMTKDGHPVAFHDHTLTRLTGRHGRLEDHTLSELKELKVSGTEPIATLEEICACLQDTQISLMAEIKQPGIELEVGRTLQKFFDHERIIIGSFFHRAILHAKTLYPHIKTAAILEGAPLDFGPIIEMSRCDIVALGVDALDQEAVANARKYTDTIFAWTLREEVDIEVAASLGIDGLITDYPDLASRILLLKKAVEFESDQLVKVPQ